MWHVRGVLQKKNTVQHNLCEAPHMPHNGGYCGADGQSTTQISARCPTGRPVMQKKIQRNGAKKPLQPPPSNLAGQKQRNPHGKPVTPLRHNPAPVSRA
jgi:hypothetical protein